MKKIKSKPILISIFLIIYFIELIRTAFITDDAGITLRSILNFINGYGPTFNIDERVQAFTHPMWFLILAITTLLFGNVFYATFFVSIGVSVLNLWLLTTKLALNNLGMLIGLFAIILSKSFIDFSTSGLENPLSHLFILLSLFSGIYLLDDKSKKYLIYFFLNLGFLFITRQDLILIFFPLILYILFNEKAQPKTLIISILIGSIPVILWTTFSLFYYGFPFPNTAYAKLATGITKLALFQQGIFYFIESFIIDPLTLSIIIIGFFIGFKSGSFGICLSTGILLYLLYIINIGGDFMAGRFFTSPFLISLVILSRYNYRKSLLIIVCLVIAILGLFNIKHTLLSGIDYKREKFPVHGVDDVRGFYYRTQGLLTSDQIHKNSTFLSDWKLKERKVEVTCGNMGFQSLHLGPNVHLIDLCALSDPLLSRLPSIIGPWQSGHFYRALPQGYIESVAQNQNLIIDSDLHNFYDSIRLITRESLTNWSRIKEIYKINLSKIQNFNNQLFRYPINLDEKIDFKQNSKGSSFLNDGYSVNLTGNGWATPESWGVWAMGKVARLSLRIPSADKPTKLILTVQVLASNTLNSQIIEIYEVTDAGHTENGPTDRFKGGVYKKLQTVNINGTELIELKPFNIVIPIDSNKNNFEPSHINLEFRFPTPLRPMDISENHKNDSRELVMGLISAIFK